ncbi:alpha/beta hydrolase [Cryobacterium zhongshanensis]|uniref:Alpha/beta hydrolase n=1 Tax=Cryobacterium zhongshanensis TaxID=2928153 RepID=A0AA41QVI4_9MICO|nr:alpha/beta hydrolase [Cryobacterium zhongshanensis]MCI4657852.1 alpha/beta hydrolase [Cryobacterium zhongshanensis]
MPTSRPQRVPAALAGAPAIIGALDGVPWPARFTANKTNIAQARKDQAATIASLREQIAAVPQGKSFAPQRVDLQNALAAALKRELTYQVMAGDDHQVLLFDPAGNGRYAEVHGTLSAKTENIRVIVNGTTLNMDSVLKYDLRAKSFYDLSEKSDPDGLVTITWMGTDFPGWETYAQPDLDRFAIEGGPRLARFVAGIDELSPAPIGVVGHSAGGAIVGSAEVTGMPAAYVMHVESAGAGPGVQTIADYAHPETERFAITAPGDPIQKVQALKVLGADPDGLAGIKPLESGYPDTGFVNFGEHDGIFSENSTGWFAMFNVITDAQGTR